MCPKFSGPQQFLGLHQNFAPGTGFSSISYPEFGLITTLFNPKNLTLDLCAFEYYYYLNEIKIY